jgi:L-aspartate oxidase
MALGARFDRTPHGLALGQEAAHSRARIVHAQGDATGAEMVRTLRQAVRQAPWVTVVEETAAEALMVQDEQVLGVVAQAARQGRQIYAAGAVVLATGGVGQLFRHTTNPPEATADGLAMAARAGARLADLEFVQFHPTALATGSDPLPLLTEALRGAGAVLVNSAGQRFMVDAHPAAELAPRDVVAREIWRQMQAGHTVFLDGRAAIGAYFPTRFPTVFAHCQQHGLDPRRDLLPVVPAAHYHMGGVAVDLRGRTSLAGLWACGEVACTGVHGANRLASNSLLEALVFGERVGTDIQQELQHRPPRSRIQPGAEGTLSPGTALSREAEHALRPEIRALMWEHVGLVRTATGLRTALQALRALETRYRPPSGEVNNLLTVAQLMAVAALQRSESRGAHCRADYPTAAPQWQRHSLWTAGELGATLRRLDDAAVPV